MIRPVFTFHLNHKILTSKVTIGKYDGTHACLTAATAADKVLIHSPHRRTGLPSGRITWSESHAEVAMLTVSQPITALLAGKLFPDDDKDILVIGSPTHILAYNVENNTDKFYNKIPEGSLSLAIGHFGSHEAPIVLVGGVYVVRGFDSSGTEIFWTAVNGQVNAMVVADLNSDGQNELVVGSDDSTIRVYKSDASLLYEWVETAPVCCLAYLGSSRVSYALTNGTVGVYEEDVRLWRVKSKSCANAIRGFDLAGTGSEQLITGWKSGKVDARDSATGDVVFKVHLSRAVAGIMYADYRGVGKIDLISCTDDGEICGYATQSGLISANLNLEQDAVRDLLSRKNTLLLEMQHYEVNSRVNDVLEKTKNDGTATAVGHNKDVGMIPANTRLQISVTTNIEHKQPHVEVTVCTNNSTIVRCVLIFAEGLFPGGGESLIVHPANGSASSKIIVPIRPFRDVPVDIHIKAFVGYENSAQFHVFEISRLLPRFSMYALPEVMSSSPKTISQISKMAQRGIKTSSNYVKFQITERMQRICIWINKNFLLCSDVEVTQNEPQLLKLLLRCLRNDGYVFLEIKENGEVTLRTDDMALAGNIVQSLVGFLDLEQLETVVSFENDEERLRTLLERLKGLQDAADTLQSERVEQLSAIRGLAVRAEDSRVYNQCDVIRNYMDISAINADIIRSYAIRMANFSETQQILKETNKIIQQASRLRAGKFSTNIIKECRNAIKNNSMDTIIKILRNGHA